MTDATRVSGGVRADGGAGSDSAPDARYEWRVWIKAMQRAGFDQFFGPFSNEGDAREEVDGWHRAFAVNTGVYVGLQRRRVGPWEDVD